MTATWTVHTVLASSVAAQVNAVPAAALGAAGQSTWNVSPICSPARAAIFARRHSHRAQRRTPPAPAERLRRSPSATTQPEQRSTLASSWVDARRDENYDRENKNKCCEHHGDVDESEQLGEPGMSTGEGPDNDMTDAGPTLPAVDTMWTQPAQIQTESADQNRPTRELIAARTP